MLLLGALAGVYPRRCRGRLWLLVVVVLGVQYLWSGDLVRCGDGEGGHNLGDWALYQGQRDQS